MATQRILRGAAATLRLTTRNSDGTISAPGGTVTVGVTKADGTTVVAAGSGTGGAAGSYTVAVTAADTADLGQLQGAWTNGTTTWATKHNIAGGFYFSLAEIRAFDAGVLGASAQNPFTDDELLTARQAVEDEAERICDRAFVPRYQRITVDGSGTTELLVGLNDIRRIRTARVYSSAGASTYTALGATALAGLVAGAGTVRRTDGDVWDEGTGNIVLEVEYGFDELPPDLVAPLLVLLRHRITEPGSDVLDRATEYSPGDGSFSRLDLAADPYRTGIQLVDAALGRYSRRTQGTNGPGGAGTGGSSMRPASRPLSPEPSWRRNSLFHGR